MVNEKITEENIKLLFLALKRFGIGIFLLGIYLFILAGSFWYWNAWIFLFTFTILILSFGCYLYNKDKELLKKRLKSREEEKSQKIYVILTIMAFLGTFTISGLDYRFTWSNVRLPIVIVSLVVLIACYALFVVTLLQNQYASKIIEIQKEQRVINTGVYSIVRHPLYTAVIFMFSASALVLGSYYALIPQVLFIIAIILRLKNEEIFLSNNLPVYKAYLNKVKYRLIPFIW